LPSGFSFVLEEVINYEFCKSAVQRKTASAFCLFQGTYPIIPAAPFVGDRKWDKGNGDKS
jgi:hypothetical protein